MRKINFKIVFFVLLVLVAGIVFFVIFKPRNNTEQITESFRQNLNVPNYFQETSLPIDNKIKKADFDFPSSLSYLKQTNLESLNTNTINKISSNFGFGGEPITFNDVKNGKVFIWNGDNYSLTIIPKNNSVQLVSNSGIRSLIENSGDKIISDEEMESIAFSLLTSKAEIDSNNLKFVGFSYFKVQNGPENLTKTDRNNAQVVQLNYSEGDFKYPIITTDPDKSQISIQLLKNGHVVNLNANLGFGFQESVNKYPLKNYQQFSEEIGSSILVSLNDNNVNLPDIKSSDIVNLTVEKASLVYLLDFSDQKIYQPVFLIEGTAQVTNYKNPINASLYLPAFDVSE
jgi:hypothetical protein